MTMIVFDRIIEYGIIFLIVFTPLAFGSVHPWAYSTMELTICFLVMIWALKQIIKILGLCSAPACRTGREYTSTGRNSKSTINNQQSSIYNRFGLVKTPMNIPIVLFIGLVVFQLTPLPSGILQFLSPNTHDLYRMTLPGEPAVSRTGMQNQKDAFSDKFHSGELSTVIQQTINNLPSQIPGPDRRADRTRAGRNPQPESPQRRTGKLRNSPPRLTGKLQTWMPISIYSLFY